MSSKILAGRYELFEKIGEGGMSVVYKAKDKLLNRYVAIKVLKPEFVKDQKFIESFRRESQAAASLSHPNIVNIFDVGQEGNIHYIVMELVESNTLSDLIQEAGPLPYPRVIEITKQIAAALSVAHKHQIVHRDVKPHNVLMTPDGTAKITDFGIAKAVNSSTIVDTTGGGIMGSVHYFSPEQARGGYVDEKSDIYSLGIVMYEMLTGRVPFDGDNPVNIALMHINSEMVPPSKLISGVPPELEKIVLKATDKYQTNRFASADELIQALDNLELVGRVVGDSVFMTANNDVADPEKPMVDTGFDDGEDEYDDEDDYKKTKNKKNGKSSRNKKILIAVIAALVVLAAVGVAFALLGGKTVIVPDLTGKTYEEAQQMAKDVGFDIVKDEPIYDAEVKEGCVAAQNPEGNTQAKEGTAIHVNLSKGPETGSVPDVLGMTEEKAREELGSNGFAVKVSTGQSGKEKGTVFKQTPEGGSSEKEGAEVEIFISDGSLAKVAIPYMIGKDIDTAKAELIELGLTPGKVTYEASNTYSVNQVMWQQYDANQEVSKGTKVKLKVSTGPETSQNINMYVDFSDAENEMFFMTVTVTDDSGTRNVVSNQQRNKSDGGEYIKMEGKGKGTVRVIFDGKQVTKKKIDFTKGTVG